MAATPTRSLRPAPNAAARMQEVLRRQEATVNEEPMPSQEEEEDASVIFDYHTTALPETSTTTLPETRATALPPNDATDSALGSVVQTEDEPQRDPARASLSTSNKVAHTTRSKVAKTTRNTAAQLSGSKVAQVSGSVVGSTTSSDPVREAMLGMLAQPYPEDMESGVMTVTSVKIPKPVWERLEYARTITKKDKQDIIAEALQLYFDQIVKGIAG